MFRQVVTMEVFWSVEPGEEKWRDWEGEVRGAIIAADPSGWPGIGTITEPEELRAARSGTEAGEQK